MNKLVVCTAVCMHWPSQANIQLGTVVPEVLAAASVDEKNKALCNGIDTYFTSEYGTRPNKKKKKNRKMRGSGKALVKLRTERNKLRSEMRKAKIAAQDTPLLETFISSCDNIRSKPK